MQYVPLAIQSLLLQLTELIEGKEKKKRKQEVFLATFYLSRSRAFSPRRKSIKLLFCNRDSRHHTNAFCSCSSCLLRVSPVETPKER